MKSKDDIIELLSRAKSTLEKRFGVNKIGLFGSYSVGTNTSESDIDLLYTLRDGHKMGLADMYAFELYVKEVLGIDKLDLVDEKYLNPIIELEIEDSLIYV